MDHLYQYTSAWYSGGRSEHPVCQGRAAFVRRYIKQPEFMDLFGGFVLSADASGEEYLGVWSRRMCSRFRRILRERGAVFEIKSTPPKLRLKATSSGKPEEA